jgi:PIF1-like helicase/Helicase
MQNRFDIEAVDRLLRDIRDKPDLPFGGVPFVFGGDFAQIPPVVNNKQQSGPTRALCFNASLRSSPLFQILKILRLTQNMRVADTPVDQVYGQWLRQLPYNPSWYNTFRPPGLLHTFTDPEEFTERVYPKAMLANPQQNPDFFAGRGILAATNATVNHHNERITAMLPGPSTGPPWVYLAKDRVIGEEGERQAYTPEYLAGINNPGLQPSRLELKPEVLIMIIRNINPVAGLVNGTKLRVKVCKPNSIVAEIIGGTFDGEERFIPRILLNSDSHEQHPGVELQRLQFPIRLCFAMTINKSQGQTMNTVGIDLRDRIFSHGQLYVALSRVQSVSNLYILLPGTPGIDPLMSNEVWPELLLKSSNDDIELMDWAQLEREISLLYV